MATSHAQKIPVGEVLADKYRVTREIGRGGMAAVYEAENVDIGKRVAIKVLAAELTSSAIVVERFLREARAAAAIRSPFICDVYDSGRLDDGRPFLVLELLEGESLYERMTKARHLDVDTTLAVMTQTCRGLTKAHAANIVHRDLKPENIFLTKDEEGSLLAKILDFGLAKFYAPLEGSGSEGQARLTREGAVFGTPAYMSPEQVRGQGGVDHRADLWALGCITYECLTGKTVWSTEQGVAMTFAQIASSEIPDAKAIREDIPDGFSEWFKKALDRKIERRFQTAKEFAEELARALSPGAQAGARVYHVEDLETVLDASADGGAALLAAARASIPSAASSRMSGEAPPLPPPRRSPAVSGAAIPGLVADMPSNPGTPAPVSNGTISNPLSSPGGAGPLSTPTSTSGYAPISAPSSTSGANLLSPGNASRVAFVAPTAPAGDSRPETDSELPSELRRSSTGRAVVALAAVALLGSGAYAGYRQFLASKQPDPTPTAVPTVTAAPTTSASGSTEPIKAPELKAAWQSKVAAAQEAVASGKLELARDLLGEAMARSNHTTPSTMRDQVLYALTSGSGCKLTGLARPRTYDVDIQTRKVAAGRPAIAWGPKGALVVWADAHTGTSHAYGVPLDESLKPRSEPVDLTPEGGMVSRPEILPTETGFALLYGDEKGAEAGTFTRTLDADGRPLGKANRVAAAPKGAATATFAQADKTSFFLAWSAEQDAGSNDIFLRKLSLALEPLGEPVRLTDLAPVGTQKPRALAPSLAVAESTLHVAFRVDRDPLRPAVHLRVPIADAEKSLGASTPAGPGKRTDRTVGEMAALNTDKTRTDTPSVACGTAGCFMAWHGEGTGGAWVAFVEAGKTAPLWRTNFAKRGSRPTVAISKDGRAIVAFLEQRQLSIVPLDRSGAGTTPSRVVKAMGPDMQPALAPGAQPGEWYVAWSHFEGAQPEPYAARISCK